MTDSKSPTRRNFLAMAGLAALAATTMMPGELIAQTPRQRRAHPRIVRAIEELSATKEYLEKSPNIFGGRKAKAITAIEVAIVDLRLALEVAD